MKFPTLSLVLCLALAGCGDGNPFEDNAEAEPGEGEGDGGDEGTGIESDRVTPPGTGSPTPARGIFRSEPTSDEGRLDGNGFASSVTYDAANDTFSVDNLGFDGDNVYARGTAVSSLGPSGEYQVYEADAQYPDTMTGRPINQFTHRAIYGISNSGNTEFAIVRTGAYTGYGFGGFVYQRSNSVDLPATGQALYTGTTAGTRDFDGAGGLQYSTADISIAIDFDDFNDTTETRGDAVRGFIDNRVIYDVNGNDITAQVVANINNKENANLSRIPTATFRVGPGVLDANGEIIGTLSSDFVDLDGTVKTYEEGNYYAIVSGDNAEEIVGVLVTETGAEQENVTVRDTSGFIVYR